MEWLIEYDITKVDMKNSYIIALLKLIEDARIEDTKNIIQLTPHKVRVNISKEVEKTFDDSIKEISTVSIKEIEDVISNKL